MHPVWPKHPPPTPPIHNLEPMYERLKNQNHLKFEGKSDPIEAKEWLRTMEIIFYFMHLNDSERLHVWFIFLRRMLNIDGEWLSRLRMWKL